METIGLILTAMALVALGCAATVALVHLHPLRIQVLAQPHGRYAGLSAGESEYEAPRGTTGGTGLPIGKQPAPNLIVA